MSDHRNLATRAFVGAVIALGLGCAWNVRSATAADEAELKRHVAALSGDTFAEREQAERLLVAAGEPAVALVVEALAAGDAETEIRGLSVLAEIAKAKDKATRQSAHRALVRLSRSGAQRISRLADTAMQGVIAEYVAELEKGWVRLEWEEKRLRSVRLDGRTVDESVLAALEFLTPLELNLSRTEIGDDSLKQLALQTQLEVLNLESTKVTDAGLQHLRALPNLRVLYLNRTAVTDEGLDHLRDHTKLTRLHIGGTKISGAGLKALTGCALEVLSFEYSPVDDQVLKHVLPFKNSLRTLALSDTKVTEACVNDIASLTQLEVLTLDNCAMSDASVRQISSLKKLTLLRIADANISAAGFRELNSGLKDAKIVAGSR
jgi:hypothetical protein